MNQTTKHYSKLKLIVYNLLDPESKSKQLYRIGNTVIIFLITMNLIVVVLDTVVSIRAFLIDIFRWYTGLSIVVFSLEYLLRIWISDLSPIYKSSSSWRSRFRYILSVEGLVDLISVIPYFLPIAVSDSRFLMLLRMTRFISFFKIAHPRYFLLGR